MFKNTVTLARQITATIGHDEGGKAIRHTYPIGTEGKLIMTIVGGYRFPYVVRIDGRNYYLGRGVVNVS